MSRITERDDYIDAARGFALLLIIMGHAIISQMPALFTGAKQLLYYFHVQSLFIISGMVFSKRADRYKQLGLIPFVRKKAKSMLLPMVVYAVIVYVFVSIGSLSSYGENLVGTAGLLSVKGFVYKTLINQNPYCVHIWFLSALFMMSVLQYLIHDHRVVRILMTLVMPIISICLIDVYLPNTPLVQLTRYWVYFSVGTFLTSEFILEKSREFIIFGIVAIVALLIYSLSWPNGAYTGKMLVYQYALMIVQVYAAIGTIAVGYRLANCRFLKRVGIHSMSYYLYHQPFLCVITSNILYGVFHVPALLTVLLAIAFSIVGTRILVWVFSREKIIGYFRKTGLPYEA